MFGLVKASRLREAEDDHDVAAEALRHAEDRIANLETESETWEKLYFAQFRESANNLRATCRKPVGGSSVAAGTVDCDINERRGHQHKALLSAKHVRMALTNATR